MTYNLTSVASSSGPLALVQYVNSDLMNGMLGVLLLIGLCVIFFLGFYFSTREVGQSAAGAIWVCAVLALLMRAASLVNDLVIFVVLILAAVAVGFVWASD